MLSCGAVVYHHEPNSMFFKNEKKDSLKFLLIQHANGGHWDSPKGGVEYGETEQQTALREINEETGIQEKQIKFIHGFKSTIQYKVPGRGLKTVVYFLAQFTGSTKAIQPQESEVLDYKWCSFKEGIDLINYPENKQVLTEAFHFLSDNA